MVEPMTTVAERACGFRLAGAIYLSCPLGAGGRPVEDFLIDPPQPLDIEAMGLSAIGTKIVPWKTQGPSPVETHYVFDIVGEEHYPNVADFVEEVRRQGLSRRIARNSDFAKLDGNSRVVLVHRRAFINNVAAYHKAEPADEHWCPRDHPRHVEAMYEGMCAALYWQDVAEGIPVGDEGAPEGKLFSGSLTGNMTSVHMHRRRTEERAVVRRMPSFAYRALRRPDGVQPQYQYAAFASFPIRVIEVVKDTYGDSHVGGVARASASSLPVTEVDE